MIDLNVESRDHSPLVYLACPYSHDDASIMEVRYREANAACAALLRSGYNTFSPITHSHPLSLRHDVPSTWDFWSEVDTDYIRCSYCLVVLALPGWRESTGVTEERRISNSLDIPTRYLDPETYDVYYDARSVVEATQDREQEVSGDYAVQE